MSTSTTHRGRLARRAIEVSVPTGQLISALPCRITSFAQADMTVTPDFVSGGHNGSVWRIVLKDFLTRTAFQPLPFASWAN